MASRYALGCHVCVSDVSSISTTSLIIVFHRVGAGRQVWLPDNTAMCDFGLIYDAFCKGFSPLSISMQTNWGFSRTELKVALKVLNQIADNPHLLQEHDVQDSGIQRFFSGVELRERPAAAKGPDRPQSPSRAAVQHNAFAPAPGPSTGNSCRMNPGLASLQPKPKPSWARDPPARSANPKARPETVMPDYTAECNTVDNSNFPSGSTKYSAGQSFKRSTCTNHKYGGGASS